MRTGRSSTKPSLQPEMRSEEHTSELQSHHELVCRLLLEKKKTNLACRAAHSCGGSVASRLRKGIPAGAGLGAGSAETAAVLVTPGADPYIAEPIGGRGSA